MEGFVVGRFPDAYAEGVPIDTEVAAVFAVDVDPRTLGEATFHLTTSAGVPVPSKIVYADRTARLRPNQPLAPGAVYRVHVVGCSGEETFDGLLSITGEPLVGSFSWQFRTSTEAPLDPPDLLAPGDATLVAPRPELSWLAVTGASLYEAQIATSQSFFRNVWSSKVAQTRVPVGIELADGGYYWRVRAIAGDRASGWSEVWGFTVDRGTPVQEPWPNETRGSVPETRRLVLVEPSEAAPLDASKVALIVPAPPDQIDLASISLTGRAYFADPAIEEHGPVEIAGVELEDLGDGRTRVTVSF